MDVSSVHLAALVSTEVFCALGALFMAVNVSSDMGSMFEVRSVRTMLLCYVAYCLLDTCWNLIYAGKWTAEPVLYSLLTCVILVLICLINFWWAVGLTTRLSSVRIGRASSIALLAVPLLALIVLVLSSMSTGLVFTLDSSGAYSRGRWFWLAMLLGSAYALVLSVRAIWGLATDALQERRALFAVVLRFAVPPLVAAMFDSVFPGTPAYPLALLCSFVIGFATMQERLVLNDPLTGLNNRRRADKYLAQLFARDDGVEQSLFLFDIDRFKQVNDVYGHAVGDVALCCAATAARQTVGRFGGFAARWGGDEFLLVIDDASLREGGPEAVEKYFHAVLNVQVLRGELPVALHATCGYTRIVASDETPAGAFARADQMLMERKGLLYKSLGVERRLD
ncbi:GGDEF domain-containing protein [Parafannyhessea umbonata]|uniref:Diguanylate cyclase (GGDEF) domain-containing protein n=1 Tax=Parafannyhessea umbonata TaxID=604330 RepID=A0A1H9P1X1_9ACTN|nr:diguanylate cyclase [Parafannyhessea umbonata]SER42067.1 diguanylate cyclase (GGDEF) domain-containing protein [Parafannyhessea umbonata]